MPQRIDEQRKRRLTGLLRTLQKIVTKRHRPLPLRFMASKVFFVAHEEDARGDARFTTFPSFFLPRSNASTLVHLRELLWNNLIAGTIMLSNQNLSRRSFLGASAAALGTMTLPKAFADAPSKKLVLLAGKPSHGPMEHEFNAGILLLKKCLLKVPGLDVVHYTNGWPDNEKAFQGANGILLFADGGGGHPFIQQDRLSILGDFMGRGVGLMCRHYAVEVPKDKGGKELQDWIGGYYEHMWSCNPMWAPEFKELPAHEITRGVQPFSVRDEWYFNMRFRPEMKGVTPILSAKPSDTVRDGPYVYPKGPYRAHPGGEGPSRGDDVGGRAAPTAAAASASPAVTSTRTGRTTISARSSSTPPSGSARPTCRRTASLLR